jgi:hypothetical protein
MTNHPNRRKPAPFEILAGGTFLARAAKYAAAHEIAQAYSDRCPAYLVEVIDHRPNAGGIVGQYRGGKPTDEFKSYPPPTLTDKPTLQDAADLIRAFIAVLNARTVAYPDIVRLSDQAQAFLTATRL